MFLRVGAQDDYQLHKVSKLCLDNHQVKPEDLEIVGELSEICSPIVFKCFYLARIGRPDLLWTDNYLARLVTQRNRTCDLRLARPISYMCRTTNCTQHCHVGNQATDCKLRLCQDADFAGNLTDSKSTSGGVLSNLDHILLCQFHGL